MNTPLKYKVLTVALCVLQTAAMSQSNSDQSKGQAHICSATVHEPCVDTAPSTIESPNPKYSTEARKAKLQGVVILFLVVDADGLPRNIKVEKSLGKGLDEEAIKVVERWRFKPATKAGKPVAASVHVQVAFHLY